MRLSSSTVPETWRRLPPESRPPVEAPGNTPRPHWLRWVLIAISLLLIAVVVTILAVHSPYSERTLIPTIQKTFHADVKIEQFRHFYFPHPGCEAKSITLTRPQNATNATSTATVLRMTLTGTYSDLIFRPHHLAEIRLDGLVVRISKNAEGGSESPENRGGNEQSASGTSTVSIGTIMTNGAVLEFEREADQEPLKFEIHKLTLESVAAGQPMAYRLSMGNPEPPGELESRGSFGPWNEDIGRIPLHGVVRLSDAKLDKYAGIGGTFESNQRFSGTLERIDVDGEATMADFAIKSAKHPMRIHTQFHVIANGMKGEARIREAVVHMGQTTAHVQGNIATNARVNRRETTLDFSIHRGRAEDMLWLFNGGPKPAVSGLASCSGHVLAPKFGKGFLESLVVKGDFEMRDGHFRPEVQIKVNELSARGQGKRVKNPGDAPEVAVDNLSSDVTIEKGVAHFSDLNFQVPGAEARMHGTFSFLNDIVELHGDLRTEAPISKDTSGVKAVLLKPLDPLFRKKHAGAQVPVVMDGPIDKPHYGTDIVKKK